VLNDLNFTGVVPYKQEKQKLLHTDGGIMNVDLRMLWYKVSFARFLNPFYLILESLLKL